MRRSHCSLVQEACVWYKITSCLYLSDKDLCVRPQSVYISMMYVCMRAGARQTEDSDINILQWTKLRVINKNIFYSG